jgi:SAM-dependent methyltransferase
VLGSPVAPPLLLRGTAGGGRRLPAGAVGLAQLLDSFHNIPLEIYQRHVPPNQVIRDFYEGIASHVMVTDEPSSGIRQMWINSIWVASSAGPHRAIGFLPGLLVSKPRRALGIGLGTGQSFPAVLRHGVSRLDCVEIDPGVIDISTRWFRDANQSLFDDPRVSVYTDDGRAFLRAHKSAYDLIVLEPLQAWSSGTSNLYSREFYQEARSALSPDGVLSHGSFYGQGVKTRTMVRTGLRSWGTVSSGSRAGWNDRASAPWNSTRTCPAPHRDATP